MAALQLLGGIVKERSECCLFLCKFNLLILYTSFSFCDVQSHKQCSQTLTHLYSWYGAASLWKLQLLMLSRSKHPPGFPSYRRKLVLQTELTSQRFVIPVIIPELLNPAPYRETKAGLTVDISYENVPFLFCSPWALLTGECVELAEAEISNLTEQSCWC